MLSDPPRRVEPTHGLRLRVATVARITVTAESAVRDRSDLGVVTHRMRRRDDGPRRWTR